MKFAALAAALLTPLLVGAAASQTPGAVLPRIVCLSMSETRDLLTSNDLVKPFRAMREASQIAQAEAIDIQLCRIQGVLVYDVTLLDDDGRVLHKLIGASSGTLLSDGDADATLQRQSPGQRAAPALPLQKGQ